MSQYLLIELNVKKFNANSGFYTVGLPALTAFAGFFHNLQRKINTELEKNEMNGEIIFEDFAILAKNIVVREGHPKYIKALKSSDKFGTGASTIDEKVADGQFAFILKYKEDMDEYTSLGSSDFSSFFKKMLQNTKLAGGYFDLVGKVITSNDFKEINKKIKNKNYFYLVDKSHELQELSFDDYIQKVSRRGLKNIKKEQSDKLITNDFNLYRKHLEELPYYVPIVPGYHLLETPTHKKDSALRNKNYKHAFAEPILSLARFQTVNSVLYHIFPKEESNDLEIKELPRIFWNYKINNNFYYVAAKEFNN